MLAVRLPKLFAAPKAPQEREGCVTDERSESHGRKPDRPHARAPAPIAECPAQKAEGNRAGIAQENPGRVKVEYQKPHGGTRYRRARERQTGCRMRASQRCQGVTAEPKERHS